MYCAYPVKDSQIHSHCECSGGEVNALRQVCKKLVIEGLNPVGITALSTMYTILIHIIYPYSPVLR